MIDLWDIAAIDQHAHNLLTPSASARYPYPAAFTEGYDSDIVNNHARHSLFYRRSLRDIAQLLECEPEEKAIVERRTEFGLEALTRRFLQASKLKTVFLDDGFLADEILPVEWHKQFVPVQRILRLEYLAENLFREESNFGRFLERFRSEIDPPPSEVVALKSIAAYRTGLNIQVTPKDFAEHRFYVLKQETQQNSLRLADKPLIDFLVTQALEIAAKHRMPVQFHTGFGDPDLNLQAGNPLNMRSLLEDSRFHNAPIVLLHASYPYVQEAGYLASVYPQVYLDFGLAVPFLSVAGMRRTMQQLLELAPISKLMYSSDAHNIPELYYLGAKWGREVLAQILDEAIKDGDLRTSEAESVATAILSENARTLHQLHHR
ncbi:MAG TPA: amidohydrolase family protein [Waterburya sp.]|jgi:predicted TIM-barrel fold metal-dependent hydrolase